MSDRGLVDQVLADYVDLEPGKADAWNPVRSKFELGYRLNLFYALAVALRRGAPVLDDLRVLDVGCGNGRSARMYLDMGLRPDQLTGLDLRPGAVSRARELNPAISWILHDGEALPTGANWVSTTTVFSSIASAQNRRRFAARLEESLAAGGHLFYYDFRLTNAFAGREPIRARRLFPGLRLVWRQRLGRFSSTPLRFRLRGLATSGLQGGPLAASLKELAGDLLAPSHEALLLRKP